MHCCSCGSGRRTYHGRGAVNDWRAMVLRPIPRLCLSVSEICRAAHGAVRFIRHGIARCTSSEQLASNSVENYHYRAPREERPNLDSNLRLSSGSESFSATTGMARAFGISRVQSTGHGRPPFWQKTPVRYRQTYVRRTMPYNLFLWELTDGTHLSARNDFGPLFKSGVRQIRIRKLNSDLKSYTTWQRADSLRLCCEALQGKVFTDAATWQEVCGFLMKAIPDQDIGLSDTVLRVVTLGVIEVLYDNAGQSTSKPSPS